MAETDGIVVKAIAATAVITILIAGICFYLFYRYAMGRQRMKTRFISSFRREAVREPHEFRQRGGIVKGVLVDENGLEVLYLRRLEGGQLRSCVSTVWFNPMEEEEERVSSRGNKPNICKPIQQISSIHQPSDCVDLSEVVKPAPPQLQHPRDPQTEKPIPPPDLRPQAPPLPPLVTVPPPPPPPPPTVPTNVTPKPPPPPMPGKGYPAAPPPFRSGGLASSLKPPTAPRGKVSSSSTADAETEERSKGNSEAQMKMRPFHWDKVNTNSDHSLVWNEINDGSFRFDDELMETLFGYNAAKRKSPETKYISSSTGSSNSASPAQIFILDPRKSQNTAIVLKSLAISRKEILDALLEGRGLDGDTLEKLTKISPTQEETSKILQFTGNPTRLADGESFLYHILKATPSAFIRINAMLFRSNYDPEILHLKESLQTLEFGCKELRTRGIFLKLLEAILKAGNRMNAGSARGNAQGFNLSALRKLSYVKSTDGKTTLLHFVVEQVLRSEGKRCQLVDKNHGLGRSNSKDSSDQDSNSLEAKEERDKECIMLGLPILGGLSTEFFNVKKAATIDYDNLMSMSPNLTVKVTEIRQLVTQCGNGERGGFVKEMKGFLEECEDELKVVREEQKRVMELVKRTTEFYQAGAPRDKGASPLQIFGFVKDFLDKVDQVCIDVTKKLQKKTARIVGSSPPLSPTTRTSIMFQNLQSYFTPEKDRSSSSSELDDDF